MDHNVALLAIIAAFVTVAALLIITTLFKIGQTLRDIKTILARDIPDGTTVIEGAAADVREIRRAADLILDETTKDQPAPAPDVPADDTDWKRKYQALELDIAAIISAEYTVPPTYTVPASHGYQDGVKEVITRLRAALRNQ